MSTYTQPFFALLLLATTAAIAVRARREKRRLFLILGTALFLFCWPPIAWVGLAYLQSGYSEQVPQNSGVQAIVVLSSSVLPADEVRNQPVPGSDTFLRCWYAAWLHSHWAAVPVLASGGSRPETPYAAVMRTELEHLGVPAGMIWTEEHSSSTYESAVRSAELLRSKGIRKIALVTEAYHMRRAERCFRKQGIDVVPAPCEFRQPLKTPWDFAPSWRAISWNEDTLHEMIGLLWYAAQGRI